MAAHRRRRPRTACPYYARFARTTALRAVLTCPSSLKAPLCGPLALAQNHGKKSKVFTVKKYIEKTIMHDVPRKNIRTKVPSLFFQAVLLMICLLLVGTDLYVCLAFKYVFENIVAKWNPRAQIYANIGSLSGGQHAHPHAPPGWAERRGCCSIQHGGVRRQGHFHTD